MIEIRSAYSDYKIAEASFVSLVSEMLRSDYNGVVYNMSIAALQSLGIKKISAKELNIIKPIYQQYSYTGYGRQGRIHTEGEFFTHSKLDKTLFFVIYGPAIDISHNGNVKSYNLEIGVLSEYDENVDKMLNDFGTVVGNCLLKINKKNNIKDINWVYVSKKTNFDIYEWYKDNKSSFDMPIYGDVDVLAAKLMCDKGYRNQLRNISQAGFAREQDLFHKERGQNADNISEKIIKELAENNLLKTQGLLQCRKRQLPLMRLEEAEQMENDTIKKLKCGLCGANYEDELVVKGYSLSELGKKLMNKSHWMTILLTEHLINKGVDVESILWNITEAAEEIDLIVGQKGQLWVFELKDRDFGSGDAYALNYRRSKFNATKPVVFTTDKVSMDAKKVFKDIVNEVSHNVKDAVIPLYIEGIGELESKLDELMLESILQGVYDKSKLLYNISKFNVVPIVEKIFSIDLSRYDDDNDLPF